MALSLRPLLVTATCDYNAPSLRQREGIGSPRCSYLADTVSNVSGSLDTSFAQCLDDADLHCEE